MADIEKLKPGEILADASVADFISRLGLGIAEAQRALDENSIAQLGEFVQPREGLGGKSLLQLGLMPAFYHYQHADLSCSLQLSMRVAESTSLGVGLNFGLNNASSNSSNSSNAQSNTESGSETRTEARSASMEIHAATVGAISIGGQTFNLSGADPLARLRGLQADLLANPAAGIGRALLSMTPQPLAISTNANPNQVVVSGNTVAFVAQDYGHGIIQVDSNTATTYLLSAAGNVSAVTTPQASVPSYATHVRDQIVAAGYRAVVVGPNDDIGRVFFETGRHDINSTGPSVAARNADVDRMLLRIAQAIQTLNLQVAVEGFADAQPFRGGTAAQSAASNRQLGDLRAREVRDRLIANGAPAANISVVASRGSQDATAAGGPADNVEYRRTSIRTVNRTAHWVFVHALPPATRLDGVTPDLRGAAQAGNGFIHLYAATPLQLSSKKVTVEGTDYPLRGTAVAGLTANSPEAYARNLADAVNAQAAVNHVASASANVTTLLRKTQPIQMELITAESRDIEITESSGVTVTRQFSRSSSTSQSQSSSGNTTVAVGATIDFRFSRQFEQSVTGNSAISARLVSIPAPPEFLALVKDFLKE
ncbi:MAG: hypothetical protein C4K60_15705 [Ideonella sp. MAG2]|nr:MAG: hypothetical protein C4K60_15705 [Ideonella sp. MAG2]